MKTGFLFAGQGSQHPGMGTDLYEKYPEFRKVFDLLTEEEREAAFNGSPEALSDTRITQPVMVAMEIGIAEILSGRGVRADMAAGLSLGEYSALACAGVFTAEEAVNIVRVRGRAMAEASKGIDCGMAAVLGISPEEVRECCEKATRDTGSTAEAVNFNCPGQIVISGEAAAVAKACDIAKEKGAKRTMPLPVSGPFHTVFMEPASRALAEVFNETEFGKPEIPVVTNVTGRALGEDDDIAANLVKQVKSPVLFQDSLRYMEEEGVKVFVEIGPGKALSGFVRKTCSRDSVILNAETAEDIENLLEKLKEIR